MLSGGQIVGLRGAAKAADSAEMLRRQKTDLKVH